MTGLPPPTSPPNPGRPSVVVMVLVAVLLTVHFLLAVGSKRHESTTSDELAHLTAGVSYWKFHDYRLQPENGNLPQRWVALPAWLGGAAFPSLENNDFWRTSDVWVVGHQFFYETGEDHFPRLMAARAMIALFSVATGLLIFCWSRRLFGTAGAFVSLVCFTFCPTFLAHGALATSDVCMAFFFLASVGAWWRHLHDGRARTWWLSAVVLGLAFVAKFSAPFLVPMMIVMAIVRAFAPEPLRLMGRTYTSRGGKFGAAALSALGHGVVVFAVIWAFYGFRYSAFNPEVTPALQFIRSWEVFETSLGRTGEIIHAVRMKQVLPESYLYGFTYVLETVKSRGAFLNGEYSSTGWPTFFLWTFALKTTLALLAACVVTVWLIVRRWVSGPAARIRSDLYRVLPLVTLFGFYWYSSLTSHLNIGHRHILPTYPVLCIGVGLLGTGILARRWPYLVCLVGLLTWHASSAIRIAPHFIAYFNELAGGPENGRFHLVDSSLDWGQDLPALKDWLDANAKGEPVYLSYFGTGEPAYYHLRVRRLTFINNFRMPLYFTKLEPGIYCVSATMLAQVYGTATGNWTREREVEFEQLRALEKSFGEYSSDPKLQAKLEQAASGDLWMKSIKRYDALRLARLCAYLRARKPDANLGYSILVYRLNAAEIAGATEGSMAEWATLIEKTRQAPQ